MEIVSLNIWQGGGDRVRRLLEWLDERSPDVVVMPEWRDSSPAIRTGLEQRGFQVATASLAAKANGVLIAANRPFAFRCATPPAATAGALIAAEFNGLRMMAAYFPQSQFKRPFFFVPLVELQAAGERMVGHLLTSGPEAIAQTKACASRAAWSYIDDEVFAGLIESHAAQRQSDEAAEGFASFLEKRPARWNRVQKRKV